MHQITFLTQTLGCRVNQSETRQLTSQLIKLGYQPVKTGQKPAIVIINTCVITNKGEKESTKAIRQLKKTYPDSFMIITGCAVNLWLETQLEKLALPADLLVTNQEKLTIPQTISQKFPLKPESSAAYQDRPLWRSLVKIQDGCNHFCTYCIVPFLRTNPVSQEPKRIINQINQLLEKGTKEVILCGINLSLYGQDLRPATDLNQLIKDILEKTDIARLSLSSLTPNLINQELKEIFRRDQNQDRRLSAYLHLALQSASPTVLSRMNRPGEINQLAANLADFKKIVPGLNLRADIMVGFPGETEEEFNQTLAFVQNTKITFGHLFRYSPRPQTQAQKQLRQGHWAVVDPKIKKARQEKLAQAIRNNRQKHFRSLVGQSRSILVLKSTSIGWWGLTDNYWPVKITDSSRSQNLLGEIITGQITGNENSLLRADFIGADQAL